MVDAPVDVVPEGGVFLAGFGVRLVFQALLFVVKAQGEDLLQGDPSGLCGGEILSDDTMLDLYQAPFLIFSAHGVALYLGPGKSRGSRERQATRLPGGGARQRRSLSSLRRGA